MTDVAIFAIVFAAAYPLLLLRERLRPEPYDWPRWVWRVRVAVAAYRGRHGRHNARNHRHRTRRTRRPPRAARADRTAIPAADHPGVPRRHGRPGRGFQLLDLTAPTGMATRPRTLARHPDARR